ARSRAYASPCPLLDTSPGSLRSAGLSFDRRDSHPLDVKQDFRSLPRQLPSFLTSLAWSHTVPGDTCSAAEPSNGGGAMASSRAGTSGFGNRRASSCWVSDFVLCAAAANSSAALAEVRWG